MRKLFALIAFFSLGFTTFSQNNCGCTNCPVAITDNGNFNAEIFIQNTGPDILDGVNNCLQSVCFTVDHTWIGDLDFTLTAPDGTCYIIMGDQDNNTNGCGSSCDNIDICIDVGTGNPAGTGTSQYASLTGNAGNCVAGNYTIATGVQNVNGPCNNSANDLDIFNNGTGTVSGTWTLTVGDNCGLDTGFLTDWSLSFCDESGINCSSSPPAPACNADEGTYTYEVNGQVTASTNISLCPDDCFDIISNQDYTLPPSFPGDSAQLMYLVYDGVPSGNDPSADPNFTNVIIPGEVLSDCNDASSPIVSTLGTGTYYFRPVTGDQGAIIAPNEVDYDKDGDGCYEFGPTVEVTYLDGINLTAQVSCDGTLNGNGVEITPTGGAPDAGNGDYNFTNNGGDGNVSPSTVPSGGTGFVTGLGQGDTYNVLVTDANGCQDSISNLFILPTFTTNVTNATDCGSGGGPNNDGEITVNVDNGSGNGGPYNITLNGNTSSGTSASESGLTSGSSINFTIEDNEGCVIQGSETIGSDGVSVTINSTITNASCGGLSDGEIEASFTVNNPNGAAGISVSDVIVDDNGNTIDPTPDNNTSPAIFPNLPGGGYTVQVELSNGCVFTEVVNVVEPNPVEIDTVAVGPPSCNEMVTWDGSINVATSGGTQPRVISWFNANDLTTPVGGNVGQLTQLEPGTYWAVVEDDNGCTDSIEVDIIAPGPISIDTIIKRVSCTDSLDGSITVTDIQNTAGSLTFDWTPNGETTQSISGLAGGDYGLTITDQNGCVGEFNFFVPFPDPIVLSNTNVIDSDCFPGTNGNGQVSAQASGGWSGNFSFQWYNVADTSINSNNPTWGNRPPGDYGLIAIDDDGCVVSDTFTVGENPVIAGVTANPDSGLDPLDVVFTNTSTTDSGTVADEFAYIWNLDNGVNFETDDVDTLVGDTYNAGTYEITLIVRNINGCRDTATVIVEVIPPLDVIAPNVFTPNNDNVNDVFSFKLQGVESFYCVIYDRWGTKVYEWTDPTTGWDGTNLNGNDVSEGVYFYMYEINGLDGTSNSNHGNFHLKR